MFPPDRHFPGDSQFVIDLSSEFPGGVGLVVRLYIREEDNRARVLCKWPSRSGGYDYSSVPLNALQFHRKGSALQLCRIRPGSSRLDAWAILQFTTIESKYILTFFWLSLMVEQGSCFFIARFLRFALRTTGTLSSTSETTNWPRSRSFLRGELQNGSVLAHDANSLA